MFVVEGMGGQHLANAERKPGRLKEEPSAGPSLGQFQYGYRTVSDVGRERLQGSYSQKTAMSRYIVNRWNELLGGEQAGVRTATKAARSGSRTIEGNVIRTNRGYASPAPTSGIRALVERLRTRGVAKENARVHVGATGRRNTLSAMGPLFKRYSLIQLGTCPIAAPRSV